MTIQPIDLHSHSRQSDGTLAPAELVRLAGEKKIKALALTDHDTTAGVDEAREAGRRFGVEIIPGVEISVIYDPGTMHILGYFLDYKSKQLADALEDFQEARRERNPLIIERLRAEGVEITLDEVVEESGGGQVGRPHFARVLVKKGYVKSFEEAFQKYLSKDSPAYVDKRRFTPEDGIRMIREAGGVAVLAHPKLLRARSAEEFDGVLDRLVAAGLGGIEAYSSCQNEAEAVRFREAGESRKLFVTGGSDFHGDNKSEVELGNMGGWARLDYSLVESMRGASGARGLR